MQACMSVKYPSRQDKGEVDMLVIFWPSRHPRQRHHPLNNSEQVDVGRRSVTVYFRYFKRVILKRVIYNTNIRACSHTHVDHIRRLYYLFRFGGYSQQQKNATVEPQHPIACKHGSYTVVASSDDAFAMCVIRNCAQFVVCFNSDSTALFVCHY